MAAKVNGSSSEESKRYRNWACIVYPDSAPAGWLELLEQCHVSSAVSPLHDMDINPGGELKKAHYHVVFAFDGKKSKDQVSVLFASFGGVGCEVVNSLRQYCRYLCHLDNPEKYKYKESDVRAFGLDYYDIVNSVSDRYQAIRDILDFCFKNQIIYYSDLMDYCSENREDWFRVLCDSGTYVVKEYLRSLEYKARGASS